MNRIMGIDWGEKRLGIAITDSLNVTAQPLSVIPNNKKTWQQLQALTQEYQIKTLVVGLPIRTSGEEGDKARLVRSWLAEAKERLQGIDIFEQDERFTTAHATRLLHEGNVNTRKQRGIVDKIAAALILEQFLMRK